MLEIFYWLKIENTKFVVLFDKLNLLYATRNEFLSLKYCIAITKIYLQCCFSSLDMSSLVKHTINIYTKCI